MKLKKQKIGYWISTFLIDVGVILLVQSGYESRVYWLHPLFELSVALLLPGIVIAVFTQRCPFCKKFLGVMFFSGSKKEFCPYCGAEFEESTQSEQKP